MTTTNTTNTTARKLRMRDILTTAAYETMTAAERRALLKVEQAKECSGLRRYPTTCARILERIPADWWSKYSAARIGEAMRLLHHAYEDGKLQG